MAIFPDVRFYGEKAHLHPYDLRFDPEDRAYVSVDPGGRVTFRLITEPVFTEANLVLDDGTGLPMDLWAGDDRFQYWELVWTPERRRFAYTFALRGHEGQAVYVVPAGVSNAVERLDRWVLDLDSHPVLDVPEWARGAIIYQIFPDRFRKGDATTDPPDTVAWGTVPNWRQFQGGDLIGIADKADYLADLGVDIVYLNPIFESPSNHKYDASDFYRVDPSFGGNDALATLVDALHEQDVKVIIDASFNHCHPRFFAFADVVDRGPRSPYWDWFAVNDYPLAVRYRPDAMRAEGYRDPDAMLVYLEEFEAASGISVEEATDEGPPMETTYEAWYGVPTMPRIDLLNPDARQYFLDVAAYWVREYDIDGYRMDVARYVDDAFWPEFRKTVKAIKPDAYLLAEIMGDAMPWLQGDRFDATMNYTFRQLCLDFFASKTTDGGGFLAGYNRMLARYAPAVAEANQNLLASHDTERFRFMADGDPVAARAAMVLQLTAPGAPGIYYGEEIGMSGGEEPASRGAFPWHAEDTWDTELLETVRSLGRLRRAHPALRSGSWRPVWHDDDAIAFLRIHADGSLLVVVKRAGTAGPLSIPVLATGVEVLWGRASARLSGDSIIVDGLGGGDGVIVALGVGVAVNDRSGPGRVGSSVSDTGGLA